MGDHRRVGALDEGVVPVLRWVVERDRLFQMVGRHLELAGEEFAHADRPMRAEQEIALARLGRDPMQARRHLAGVAQVAAQQVDVVETAPDVEQIAATGARALGDRQRRAIGRLDLGGGPAGERDQDRRTRHVQRQPALVEPPLELRQLRLGAAQMRARLGVGGAADRRAPGLQPGIERGQRLAGGRIVARDHLRSHLDQIARIGAQDLGRSEVVFTPVLAQQRFVSGLLDQRVLEHEVRARLHAEAHQQRFVDQPAQAIAQRLLAAVPQPPHHRGLEGVPDHGGDLGDRLGRAEPVEPRHQRIRAGCRDRERRQRPVASPVVAGIAQQAGFQHRLGQLLDEQRHAVGPRRRSARRPRPAAPCRQRRRATSAAACAPAEAVERQRA